MHAKGSMATSTAASSSPSSFSSSTWTAETVSGSHRFTVDRHSLTKGFGTGNHIQSGVFTVGGHDWALRYFPDGYALDGADYVSIFLTQLSDTSIAKVLVKFDMLDKNGSTVLASSITEKLFTFKGRMSSFGWRQMMKRADFERKYIKDDCFTIECTVTVLKPPCLRVPKKTRSVAAPPSNLHQHLGELLESGEGADVAFEVGGETFAAHRCVLAARSPVFRAELFGPMEEKRAQCIKIKDMDAVVFKAMLHFIYRDSLNQLEEVTEETSTSMLQHLLAAADRYGLERLRLICEDGLCKDIDVSTVATTLALAEQHHCRELKPACFDFIDSPGTMIAVMRTEGFDHLRVSCPQVVEELLEKLS